MAKYWIYDIEDCVVVNEYAKQGLPNDVGKTGKVIDKLYASQYDYDVLLEDGTVSRFKEIELNKLDEEV